jgi:hypothetical protein
MILTDENFDRLEGGRRGWTVSTSILLLGLLGLTAACGGRRVNVMRTPEQNLIAIGYSSDRSGSILRANDDAQLYCERQKKDVVYIKQDTAYQGQYDEDVTAAARTAGRVAGALGSAKGARAGRVLSSPTDYKTTFEFACGKATEP